MIKAKIDISTGKSKIKVRGHTIDMAKELTYLFAFVISNVTPKNGKNYEDVVREIAEEALRIAKDNKEEWSK